MRSISNGLLLAAAIVMLGSGCATSSGAGERQVTGVAPAPVATLPFHRYMNLIFLDVGVNGAGPLSFNLDSGLETSVLDSAQAQGLGLELRERQQVPVPGGSVELAVADGVRFGIEGLALPPRRVTTLPLTIFAPVLGRPIHGTLGHDLFSTYVVEIDYAAERLRLYAPDSYVYRGSGEILPLTIEDNQPFVAAEIIQPGRAPIPAKIKIDTGSADALGLNGSFVQATGLIPQTQRSVPSPGVALGGITENFVARLGALRLGRFTLPNIVAGYSRDLRRGGDAGTMGGEVLRRFRVIFDYARRRLILEPNQHLDEPFRYDSSGLFLVTEAQNSAALKILRVGPDTPAAEAGLREGDVITAIDGAAPPSLERVREMLSRPGERRRLRVRAGTASQEISLRLRPLI